jgi:hypothetical protein
MELFISNGDRFTLKTAQKNERNILSRLKRSNCTARLYQELWRDRKTTEAITAHHLGRIDPSSCVVQNTVTWTKGQFNVCVPVHVHEADGSISKKIFRCPLAHKVGERYSPGTVDEKMRAETGAYAWIEENCPEILTPKLHAFGFSPDLQVEQLAPVDIGDHITHHLFVVYTSGARHRLRPRPFRHQV